MNAEIATTCTILRLQPGSLAPPIERSDQAYELKFLLPDSVADRVLAWARSHLAADPHVDHSLGDAYRVNSLYFDTAGLDVYHCFGSFGRRKFRLRRYGSESRVFLERKSKSRGLVRKRRTVVPEAELSALESATLEPTWPGHWFHRRLVARRLAPQCHITYERVARVGMTHEGPIRLTVDRHIRCRAATNLSVPCLANGAVLLTGQSIVEFKFRVALPALFKTLMHELTLTPTPASKYRLSVDACGLHVGVTDVGPARADLRGTEPIDTAESVRYA